MGASSKTIKRVIRAKLDDWIKSIDNEQVRNAVRRDVFVTGGSIASMLIGEKINDFDVYFKTKETTEAVAKYYCHVFAQKNPKADVLPEVRIEKLKNLKGVEEERVVVWVQSAGAAGEEPDEDNKAAYQYYETQDNPDGDLADEYVKQITSGLRSEADGDKGEYRPVFLSQNAITLSDKLQIVIRFFGTPEDIYRNYDFIHVQQHYDYQEDKLDLNKAALASLLSRTLVYTGSLYPVCSIFRAKKFVERGWKINAGQLLKIAFQCKMIDWRDRQMVREQLTGCDAAYFLQLINKLENSGYFAEDGIGANDIDGTYICRLIDEVFQTQIF